MHIIYIYTPGCVYVPEGEPAADAGDEVGEAFAKFLLPPPPPPPPPPGWEGSPVEKTTDGGVISVYGLKLLAYEALSCYCMSPYVLVMTTDGVVISVCGLVCMRPEGLQLLVCVRP